MRRTALKRVYPRCEQSHHSGVTINDAHCTSFMLALFLINNFKESGGSLLSYMALTKNNRTERETPSADLNSLSVPSFSLDGLYGAWYGADVPLDLPRTQSSLSLDENVRAKEGGKETTGFACVCTLSMFPCGSSPVARLYTLRKRKRPRRRLPLDRVRFYSLCPKHGI